MKKHIILALSLALLILGLGACGANENKETKDSSKESQENQSMDQDQKDSKDSKSNEIQQGTNTLDKDVIKVGMELKWPPFEMANVDGSPDGVSVLIAEELGKYLGKDIEIVDMAFTSLIPAIENEKIDIIISSMGIKKEREEKISFSEPYMYFKLLPVVNKKAEIKSLDDLYSKEGLRFVAPKSFSSIDVIKKKANKPSITEFDDKGAATLELANGNADAFVIDSVTAVGISKKYPDQLDVLYDPVFVSPVGMGMRKDDLAFKEKVNEFISQMEKLGVNDKIREKYNDDFKALVGKDYEFFLNEK